VIRNFKTDFELTMGLAGCRSISEITPDLWCSRWFCVGSAYCVLLVRGVSFTIS